MHEAEELAPDVAKALTERRSARQAFDRLAPSHRREWLRHVEEAKKPETRARHIAKMIDELSALTLDR